MENTPIPSRDRDPIETILHFLFRNWILLISFPAIAGVVSFVLTLEAPRSYTASFRITAPPVPVIAFDELWRSPESPHDGRVAADGSVLVAHTAATEPEAREPVNAAVAATRLVAAEAIAYAKERQARIADMEARLIDHSPAADLAVLSDQASALSLVMVVGDTAMKTSAALQQWAQRLDEQQVAVSSSTGSNRTVPFAVFIAFTIALAIAIARWLLLRRRDDGQTG